MEDVAEWASNRGLTISVTKSHATLFTSDTHQSRLDPGVTLAGQPLPLCRHPKILGVTLDPHFTFSDHATSTANRARARLNILRALAGTSWGQSKETITTTYNSPYLVPQLQDSHHKTSTNSKLRSSYSNRCTQDGQHRPSPC